MFKWIKKIFTPKKQDYNSVDIEVAVSEDNGMTWAWYSAVTTDTLFYDVLVERRGSNIYLVYLDLETDRSIKFINSTDGGATWGDVTVIMSQVGSDMD